MGFTSNLSSLSSVADRESDLRTLSYKQLDRTATYEAYLVAYEVPQLAASTLRTSILSD